MTHTLTRRARRGAALLVALATIAVLASVTAIASSQARQAAAVVELPSDDFID